MLQFKKISLILLLVLGAIAVQAQNDYYTKKGYAIEGYDLVSYFENKAEKGDKLYTTSYDGARFMFASQKHLDLFLNNPKQYLPQYGGYCAYAIAEKNKKVSVNPKTFEIRDNKLYLFYNSWGNNTLKLWQKNILKGLQKKADQNWDTIKKID